MFGQVLMAIVADLVFGAVSSQQRSYQDEVNAYLEAHRLRTRESRRVAGR
jgi:hypothetical protein